MHRPNREQCVPRRLWAAGLLALTLTPIGPVHAGLLDGLGRAGEVMSRGEGAVSAGQQMMSTGQQVMSTGQQVMSTGQQVMSTGRQAVDAGRQAWDNRNGIPFQPPSGPAVMARDEGGPVRLIAALERGAGDPITAGSTLVALLDQGAYFVQRQAAHVTPPQDQLLAIPRMDSSAVSIDLPPTPPGNTFRSGYGPVTCFGHRSEDLRAVRAHPAAAPRGPPCAGHD